MPTIPKLYAPKTNMSVDALNAIRNSSTINYQDFVPYATPNAESIREIGAIIMDYPALQNEFINSLVNLIGRTFVISKLYYNPLAMLKKGFLDFGETVEEIFVDLIKPFQYNIEESEEKVFERHPPDVKSAFHIINYREVYPLTIEEMQLSQAFLSWRNMDDFIGKLVRKIYTSAAYDELETMKYMIGRKIIDGQIYPEQIKISADEDRQLKNYASAIKRVSDNLAGYMKQKYNIGNVKTHTPKEDQFLIVSTAYSSELDVNVLGFAFNQDRVGFIGNQIPIDSFGDIDTERLGILFKNDPNYRELSQDELDLLDSVPAVLFDKDWFQIYDNKAKFGENFNSRGYYWNYHYHVWKIFGVSPFSNAVLFTSQTPAVTEVTINPSEVTVAAGSEVQLNSTVSTTGFAPQKVNWSVDTDGVTVSASGLVTIPSGTTGSVVVTATSTWDDTKTATATITIS